VGALNVPNRALAGLDTRSAPLQQPAVASLRVEAAGPPDQGVFETLLGALIGFVFG
jgi:hypothetical protein